MFSSPSVSVSNKGTYFLSGESIIASENTIKSIDFCCRRGYFADAFTLVRKYRAMKKQIVLALMILCTGLLPLSARAENVYEISGDQGFATPEESIRYFTDCLSANSLEDAVEAFAVDHYIDNMDYYAYLDKLGAWSYDQTVSLSPEDDLSRQLDKAAMREEITKDIRIFCLSLGMDAEWRTVQKIEDTEAFLESIALKDLSALEVDRIIYAEAETQDNEKYQKSMKKLWEIQGCDRMEDYYVIYTLQDDIYIGSAQFIQYDGLWYLRDLNSTMAGMGNPAVMKISDQQYEQLLEELGEE